MNIKFLVKSFVNSKNQRCNLEIHKNEEIIFSRQYVEPGILDLEIGTIDKDTLVKFIITGKKGSYTLKDSDTAFKIEQLIIGDYDYYTKINLFSNYFTEKEILRTNGYMGFDGIYVFKFRYPLSKHLLMCDYKQ
jgi:hypothetical protein